MMDEIRIRPIGVVRSGIRAPGDAPRQGAFSDVEAEVVIDPALAEGLAGLAERTLSEGEPVHGGPYRGTGKIVLVCWMHLADRERLKTRPGGREDAPERGVFATRSPHRPNPVSLNVVELLEVRGNVLRIRGADAVDGTPVIDVKPHLPEADGPA